MAFLRLIPITEAGDDRIAAYRAIRERDLVGRQGRFIAEGRTVLSVLAGARRFRIESVLVLENRAAGVDDLLSRLAPDIPVYRASRPVMDEIAGFPMHRGILAIGRIPDPVDVPDMLASLPERAMVLVACGISNHDNMGGLFRNAAAFGADAVLLDAQCCDPLYRKAIRVSVGGVFRVPFARLGDAEGACRLLAGAGFETLALTPGGETEIGDVARAPRCAVLVGSEGEGLPRPVLRQCRAVRIGMAEGFDSLNVATAAGIALHRLSAG